MTKSKLPLSGYSRTSLSWLLDKNQLLTTTDTYDSRTIVDIVDLIFDNLAQVVSESLSSAPYVQPVGSSEKGNTVLQYERKEVTIGDVTVAMDDVILSKDTVARNTFRGVLPWLEPRVTLVPCESSRETVEDYIQNTRCIPHCAHGRYKVIHYNHDVTDSVTSFSSSSSNTTSVSLSDGFCVGCSRRRNSQLRCVSCSHVRAW